MAENARLPILPRRAFLQNGVLVLAAAASVSGAANLVAADEPSALRVALITDLHYADKEPSGKRSYRETAAKLAEAAAQYEEDRPALVVELGDLIDSGDTLETEKSYLTTINAKFAAISQDRHYVLGNHCVEALTKAEFLGAVEREKSYYSFDRQGVHFIILDACFRSDGEPYGRKNSSWKDANIPPAELEWLAADLKANDKPTIVFVHQRLDVSTDHGVKNNAEVRKLFEASGRVVAVFQGHSHKNDLNEIAGIHYCTLAAMIEGMGAENNSYSLMDVQPNGTIHLHGFRKQKSYDWERQA